MHRFLSICTAAFFGLGLAGTRAEAQGYAPAEAPKHMAVAEGLTARLVASEPLVRQPVAIDFDDRGRLWVIQYLQYPNPAGLRRVAVDRYSRTLYDRVPEPPPSGPHGADRITILEDRDGDGVMDAGHDFVSGLNLATGLAFGYGGVFVLQAPYLLFYPDRNRDDVPDGNPEVILSGFGMEDAHSVANSLIWGPDGWLYGLQGSTVTAHVHGVEFQQGVWRYHPITKRFELFCEGGGNMWGLDFDRHGNLFACTNVGGFVMLHAVQGGYYWKSFGKHGALHNPFAFGYFDHVPHQGVRGGHVALGGLFYEADAFPAQYRGKFFAADLLDHSVHWHELTPDGSTFKARQLGDLLRANDTWFAPSDMALGPDGAVYVADWHDRRTAHPDPDADWDRSNGRIYAIESKEAPRQRPKLDDLRSLSSEKLVALLDHPNVWYERKARRILAERRAAVALETGLDAVRQGLGGRKGLEILWAHYGAAGIGPPLADDLLKHPDPDIRYWAVRMLGDEDRVGHDFAVKLAQLAMREPSPAVRAQLVCSARRLPPEEGLPIAWEVLKRDQDAADAFIPLLLWWTVEHHAFFGRRIALTYLTSPAGWQSKLVRTAILGRLVRRYSAGAFVGGFDACARMLASAPTHDGEDLLLEALDDSLRGRRPRRFTANLNQQIARLWNNDPTDVTRLRLAARMRIGGARNRALELAFDAQAPENARLALLDLVADIRDPELLPQLLNLARAGKSSAIELAALAALARYDDPSVASTLIEYYPQKPAPWRSATRALMLGRLASTRTLLAAVAAGKIAASDFTLDEIGRVAVFGDPDADRLVRKHWGMVRGPTPEEKLAEVRRLNNDLRAAPGNPDHGRDLFRQHCATCHKLFGEGNEIGPELSHANRKDRDFLLVSLVDPSGTVRKEYQSMVVHTRDGRTLTGLMTGESAARIVLVDSKGDRLSIPRSEIAEFQESSASLMPEGLYRLFSPEQLRDLFSYLQSDGPPEEGRAR